MITSVPRLAALCALAAVLYDARGAPPRFAASELRAAWTLQGVSAAELPCCAAPSVVLTVVVAASYEQYYGVFRPYNSNPKQ